MKRMNKKAFTLIELIAVLTVIAIIASIAINPIINQISRSKDNFDYFQKKLILQTGQNYLNENPQKYEKKANKTYCINIELLTKEADLSSKIYDKKGKLIDKRLKLSYIFKTKTDDIGEFEGTFDANCTLTN